MSSRPPDVFTPFETPTGSRDIEDHRLIHCDRLKVRVQQGVTYGSSWKSDRMSGRVFLTFSLKIVFRPLSECRICGSPWIDRHRNCLHS
jgi:hypothetical protein